MIFVWSGLFHQLIFASSAPFLASFIWGLVRNNKYIVPVDALSEFLCPVDDQLASAVSYIVNFYKQWSGFVL